MNWSKIANNIIKTLAKTKVTLVHFERAKGEGKVQLTPTEEIEVNAAISQDDDVLDVTKQEQRDINVVIANEKLPWTPSTLNTKVLLNGELLKLEEVKYSGFVSNKPVCYILRCSHE